MAWCARAVALCCALAVAAAYTVDCNHEYTDCDTELSKLVAEDEEPSSAPGTTLPPTSKTTSQPFLPTIPVETKTTKTAELTTKVLEPEVSETTEPPKQPRLLNLNVEDLQNFANALHNDTSKSKQKVDLSDVNMDDDEDEEPRRLSPPEVDKHLHNKQIPDKFYTNLQVPFNPLLGIDKASEETDICKENDVFYKIGDRIERGCDEMCECSPGGSFDCSPRCKHPYIRRGRRLNDPLCFESPVDECCSIIACATGNQDLKVNKVEVCRYNNDTHTVGEKWHIGCEQTCSCEPNSVVTCRPRCKKLTPSEKCINVQDPSDECCEVQICDVSQDVHEEPADNVTSSTTTSTTTTTESVKGFDDYSDIIHEAVEPLKPLLGPISLVNFGAQHTTPNPAEPIGSVKVLQNNSVQVNLMHMNSSEDPIYLLLSSDGGKNFEDVELKYSNLILNLPKGKDYVLKTKESGTKFNFTITAAIDDNQAKNVTVNIQDLKPGCYQDGNFYAVGEEFHIGCTQLCECTGANQRECADLVCPSHVGLELVSKGCVRWAPSPPPQPPNCCPRAARCLSDGTCHYKGAAVPNWSEAPISLTGCEQRCFCENGELDCQEVCSPLPPLPPQTLRCPPLHRPAPVNISDDDCCKQWGCVPNAEERNSTDTRKYVSILPFGSFEYSYVTPLSPVFPTVPAPITSTIATDPMDFLRHLHPVMPLPKIYKTFVPATAVIDQSKYTLVTPKPYPPQNNITIYTLDDLPLVKKPQAKFIVNQKPPWNYEKVPDILLDFKLPQEKVHYAKLPDFVITDSKMHDLIKAPGINLPPLTHRIFHTGKVDKFFMPADEDVETNFVQLSKPNLFRPAGTDNLKKIKEYKTNKPYDYRIYGVPKINMPGSNLPKLGDKKETLYYNQNSPVLVKAPNLYEHVLLMPVSRPRLGKAPRIRSSQGLEQLVNQTRVESEGNRNLGRSANNVKVFEGLEGKIPPSTPDSSPSHPQMPFLPTVPPEIHFPTEEIPDYDQNNLHHPREPPGIPAGLPVGLPPGITMPPNYGEENKKLTVLSLQADSPTSVKLLFGLPPVLVGLRGSVDLRYTDSADEDISRWYSQVFAPADEVLTTPRLEFRLTGLKPSTLYRIKGKLFLHNLPVEPESQVYSVRTLDLPSIPTTIEEKRKEIDTRLTVVDVNMTSAHVSWRHFKEDELQFIDGVQVRFRPVGTPIYIMTEILHHSRSIAELTDLRPGTKYEASLILVPPPRATTELHDPGRVEFTTSPFVDPYNWSVTIEAHAVGSDAVELSWHGIPSPAERWVRIYRAAHACGTTRHEHDAFRLATRDLPPTIMLNGLDSNTRCRVWMELFLTNGKIKTSNVLEISTKSQDSPEEIDNEIEAASVADSRGESRGDYYGALVVVGVVAALGALTSLLLLLVLVRRHRPRSVPITPVPSAPRDSSLPPYDNPAYKLELQQETMDL